MNYELTLDGLGKSKFRSSFHLSENDKKYVNEKGIDKIAQDSWDFLNERIKIKKENDGRQTPWKGHPVFVAQHATAICCRKCVYKWHKIPEEKELNDGEIAELNSLIIKWIKNEMKNG